MLAPSTQEVDFASLDTVRLADRAANLAADFPGISSIICSVVGLDKSVDDRHAILDALQCHAQVVREECFSTVKPSAVSPWEPNYSLVDIDVDPNKEYKLVEKPLRKGIRYFGMYMVGVGTVLAAQKNLETAAYYILPGLALVSCTYIKPNEN